jgi:exonuclease III
MAASVRVTAFCLQETKLQVVSEQLVADLLGRKFSNNFSFLPVLGTRGGILIAFSEDHFRLMLSRRSANTLTVRVQMLNDAVEWSMTGVYGPQTEQEKMAFLDEIKNLRQSMQGQDEWLLCGDFNLIYKAEDKNNSRLNKRLMGKFRFVLQELELRELPLNGRKFTWVSNQNHQVQPTMSRIDRVFCSPIWEEIFPTAHLQAWASTISNHCPLILQGATSMARFKGFRFESY